MVLTYVLVDDVEQILYIPVYTVPYTTSTHIYSRIEQENKELYRTALKFSDIDPILQSSADGGDLEKAGSLFGMNKKKNCSIL